MRKIVTALLLAALPAAALAQNSNVRIIGRDSTGTDRPVLVTTDGRLQTSGTATARPTGTSADQVQGVDANGTPTTANPQLVAGSDGTNTRTIRTDTTGQLLLGNNSLGNNDGEGATNRTRVRATLDVFDGTAYNRARDANTASGTTGTGLLGVGNLGFDGTNWRALLTAANGSMIVRGENGGNSIAVTGAVANGQTDVGSPVKIGGFASTTAPTAVTAGQRVNAWYGLNGQGYSQLVGNAGLNPVNTGFAASGMGAPSSLFVTSFNEVYNGATWDQTVTATAANATTGTGLLGAGILGQYTATLPTYTAGQYGTIAMSNRGLLYTLAVDGGGQPLQTLGGDADQRATTITAPYTNARNFLLNGTGWDRSRTVQGSDGTGAGVAAVSETPNSAAGAAIVPATALGATSLVGKAAPGNLYGATVTASAAQTGTGYFIVANLAAAPATGTTLTAAQVLYCVAVNPGATASMGGTGVPDRGTVGLTGLYSTSCGAFNPVATAPLHMRIRAQ